MKMQLSTAQQLSQLIEAAIDGVSDDEINLPDPAEALMRDALARQDLQNEIDA